MTALKGAFSTLQARIFFAQQAPSRRADERREIRRNGLDVAASDSGFAELGVTAASR
jgi:hypothetical protein